MPQALLPLIPDGATQVNDRISVVQQHGQWTYCCGVHPVFEHGEEDRASFRMFSAQLVCQGSCRQAEIIQTFGVSKNSVKRSVKKYRDEGIESFFRPRRTRSSNVFTPEVVARAQELLYRGGSPSEVADELGHQTRHPSQGPPSGTDPGTAAPPAPGRRTGGQRASRLCTRFGQVPAQPRGCGGPDGDRLHAAAGAGGRGPGIARRRPDRVSGLPRRLLRRRPVRPAGADTKRSVRPSGRVFSLAGRLLHHDADRLGVGSHGVVPDPDGRAIAIPVAWGTG